MHSLRSTIRCTVCSYGFLGVRRIQSNKQQQLWWPELTPANSFAAAGVRVVAGLALRCKAGGLVGATDSWWCAERNGELGFEPLWL